MEKLLPLVNHKRDMVCLGAAVLILMASLFYVLIAMPFPSVEKNVIADINIAAMRQDFYGPYSDRSYKDRREIGFLIVNGRKAFREKYPPRLLKPIPPNTHPSKEVFPDELIDVLKLGALITMPALPAVWEIHFR